MELHAVNEQSASASPKLARIRDALIAVVSTGGLLFLLWGLATQLVDAVKTSEATDWPQADGLIITSVLVKGCRGNAQFLPDVRYQYVVDGQTYTGRRIAHGVQACGHPRAVDLPPLLQSGICVGACGMLRAGARRCLRHLE